ncbi:MAG: hypothetical protein CMP23_15965 [Rickettsiales bacterium]|nr:hypothetical protein [Rickettsiales bacterium]|tara:strand:- start:2146 stop:3345 length:1200 start_codon:yes stop_codon:yes gene_type:complete
MSSATVRLGLDRLLSEQLHLLRGKRVGLVCNASTVSSALEHAADCFAEHPDFELVRLFGPEHGLRGDAQDMIAVEQVPRDPWTGVELHSLYGTSEASLRPDPQLMADLDVVVFDIQDVGARYYTYVYTMAFCMEAAGKVGVPVVVCDRPNPIGGLAVEGNTVHEGFVSFVGQFPIANRHGMTAGELAHLFRDECGVACDLTVVQLQGWERGMHYQDCGLPWVQPSPNMPTPDTALVYPGMCFFEGTLLSEGRGATRPFEVVGAPYIDGKRWAADAAARLDAAGAGGVSFRPLVFQPTFHKHGGLACGGVQLHVLDRQCFEPVLSAVALLQAAWSLWPDEVRWRTEVYEFVEDPIAIDLLGGSAALRHEIEQETPLSRVRERWQDEVQTFIAQRKRHLLY